jgi:hypothetical protein
MRESARSLLALGALPVLLAGCRSGSPEARLRATFEACRAAVEAGDAGAATAALDPTFRGPDGLDRGAARLYLMGLLHQEKVGITVLRNEVTVRGREARQEVDLLLTGRSGSLLPQEASRRSFRLHWRETSGTWRLLEVQVLEPS